MSDRGILASFLLPPFSKNINPENISQFKLRKDSNSNRVNDLLKHNSVPITLHDTLLPLRDTDKTFGLKGDFLERITNKNYNVDLASSSDTKSMYDIAKEKNFDLKAQGNESIRDRTLINLLKSPGLTISASRVSQTIYLPSDPNQLCDRLKLLIHEKKSGINSDIVKQDIAAIVDKLIEHKCIYKKQHKQLLN